MAFSTVDPTRARALLESDEGWTYLDVRTVAEFAAGHPEGAFNVPVAEPDPATGGMAPNEDFARVVKANFPADARLVLGCAAGGRSAFACRMLEAEGFTALVNMHGGFSGARDPMGEVVQPGWQELGYPAARDASPGRSYSDLRARA